MKKRAKKKKEARKKTGKKDSYDNILVMLGHEVKKDGHPSPVLLSRIQKTVKLYRKHDYDKVILSGGATNYPVAEADMAAVFMHNTIPAEKLVLERNSKLTIHNALFVWELIKDRGVSKMTIVTSDFHLRKVKHIFSRIFEHTKIKLDFVGAKSKIGLFARLNYFIKEEIALFKLKTRGIR